jgi:hypothetical protein
MIINIRGTSGSGKSTLVREAMSWYRFQEPVFMRGRKRPLYTKLWLHGPPFGSPRYPDLAVLGSYETACGGCDGLPSTDLVCQLVYELSGSAKNVLFEGLLFSGNIGRTREMLEDFGPNFTTLAIDLPLADCLAAVNQRRRAKDPAAPNVDPKNTESKWGAVMRSVEVLKEFGGDRVQLLPRARCEEKLAEILLGV